MTLQEARVLIENIIGSGQIEIYGQYIHYKGGRYRVIDLGIVTDPEISVVVVYQGKANEPLWIRPINGPGGWLTPVNGGSRFIKVNS